MESKNIPAKPYVIGLTGNFCLYLSLQKAQVGIQGGIASGKSGVIEHLQNLGVPVIDCDKLGHQMYKKEGPCYGKVVDVFGV